MRRHRVLFVIICLFFLFFTSITIFISIDRFYFKNSYVSDFTNTESFLVIVVTSAGQNHVKRNAIRNTWLKLNSDHYKCVFVVGNDDIKYNKDELVNEMQTYGDIILLPGVSDLYSHLTVKLLNAFIHLHTFWKFKFLLKCDDDSFVRVPDIVSELRTRFVKISNLYWGFFNGNANIKRKGRWKETKWILCDRYLPYALGGGYILSHSLVEFIAQNHYYLK